MIKIESLPSIFLYWLCIISVVLADVDDPYTNGSYLALRLIGAIFCISLGLTFCFFGQDMISYIIFVAGLEIFGLFTSLLTYPLILNNNQQLVLYSIVPIAGTLGLIVSLLAAKFIKFGKLVLGVNFTVTLWLILYLLGLIQIIIVMIILLVVSIIIGIILPFYFLDMVIMISTTIVGCTLTMFGIDCIIVKGLLVLILQPGKQRDSSIDYYLIFMVIGSILLGLLGIYFQNKKRQHNNIKPQQELKLLVSA